MSGWDAEAWRFFYDETMASMYIRYSEEARDEIVKRFKLEAFQPPSAKQMDILVRSRQIALDEHASEITLDHLDSAEQEAAQ